MGSNLAKNKQDLSAQDKDFERDFPTEEDWAREKKVSQRTVARYRQKGLPYMEWGGKIRIDRAGGERYIAGRVRLRNPQRNAKSNRSEKHGRRLSAAASAAGAA